jgi:hypothetical protein
MVNAPELCYVYISKLVLLSSLVIQYVLEHEVWHEAFNFTFYSIRYGKGLRDIDLITFSNKKFWK